MCTLCQGGEVRGVRDQGNARKTLFYSAPAGRSHRIPYGTCNHIDACTWGHAQLWAAAEFGRTTGGSAPARVCSVLTVRADRVTLVPLWWRVLALPLGHVWPLQTPNDGFACRVNRVPSCRQ